MADRRAKKACTECRQQKARCDAHKFEDSICSRCRKLRLECVMSDHFSREHKRRKLSEIEHENIRLRQQLEASKAQTPSSNSHPETPHRPQTTNTSPAGPSPDIDITGYISNSTLPRTVGSSSFEASEIDDLFETFSKDFLPTLPILDPSITPNACFDSSPFLFWSIIGVASRTSAKLSDIRSSVLNVAFTALGIESSIQRIQAMLILLTWPFPKTHKHPDTAAGLTGAMLHMAMQMGLHIPISSHEYSRVRLQLSSADIDQRSELFAHVVVTYQAACVAKGIPAFTVRDMTLDPEQRASLLEKVPQNIKSQFQMLSILTRCCKEAASIGLRMMTEDRERSLDIMLRVHEREIANVTPPQSLQAKLDLLAGKVTLQALHFFKSPLSLAKDSLLIARLASNSCEYIENLALYLSSGRLRAASLPFYALFSVMASCCVLLRLVKIQIFADKVLDIPAALTALDTAIGILKNMSIQENDTASRAVTILQQLLQSKKVFLRHDKETGVWEPVPLRIRTRIAMCHVLETWAWWREEFGVAAYGSGVWPPPLVGTTPTKENAPNGTSLSSTNVNGGKAEPGAATASQLTAASISAPGFEEMPTATSMQPAQAGSDWFSGINGFSQAQFDPDFGNLIGDDMFSDMWLGGYWPDTHTWTTGLT